MSNKHPEKKKMFARRLREDVIEKLTTDARAFGVNTTTYIELLVMEKRLERGFYGKQK